MVRLVRNFALSLINPRFHYIFLGGYSFQIFTSTYEVCSYVFGRACNMIYRKILYPEHNIAGQGFAQEIPSFLVLG